MKKDTSEVERERFSWVNKVFKKQLEQSGITISKQIRKFTTGAYYRVRRDLDLYMALTGWTGFGKSLKKDTKVVYIKNNELFIDEIQNLEGKKNIETISVNPHTLKTEVKKITRVIKHKYNDKLVKIKTKSGRKLNGTLNHSFLIYDDNGGLRIVKGSELKEGMLIPSLKKINFQEQLTKIKHDYIKSKNVTNLNYDKDYFNLTYDFGFLCGAYLSEGCINNTRIIITNEDELFINQLKKCVKDLSNINYNIGSKKGTNAISFNIYCMQLVNFLKDKFGKGSGNKVIAPFVFMSNDEFKKGLLDGYFSGDGSINYKFIGNFRKGIQYDVSFTTKSEKLCDGINLLLNNYGIITTKRIRKHKIYGNYYVGRIIFQYIPKLNKLLNLKHKKCEVLNEISNMKRIKICNQMNMIPLNKELFSELRKGKCYSKRETKTRDIVCNILHNIRRCNGVGYEMFTKYLNIFNNGTEASKKLMNVYNADIFFDEIKEITHEEINDVVYDLSVEDNENFMLANGTFVHNSSLAVLFGKLIDPNFNLEDNVLYSPTIEEMKLKINYRKLVQQGKEIPKGALKPYSVLIVDEAIKVVYKMEQWSGLQRFLKKLFALARTENKIIILCIPDFLDMGNNFRKRMNYWVNIFAREKEQAYCIVEAASKNKYKNDRWNLKEHEKLYEREVGVRKYASLTPIEHLDIVKKISKNYVFTFAFSKLPQSLFDRYVALKNSHDYDSEGELKSFEKDSKYKKLFKKYQRLLGTALGELKDSSDLTNKVLGLKYGMDGSAISELITGARKDAE